MMFISLFLFVSNLSLLHGFDLEDARAAYQARTPSQDDFMQLLVPNQWKGAQVSIVEKQSRSLRSEKFIPEDKRGYLIFKFFHKKNDNACEKNPVFESASHINTCYSATLEDGSGGSFNFVAFDEDGGSVVERNIYHDKLCKSKKQISTDDEHYDGGCFSLGEGFPFMDKTIYYQSVSFVKGKKFKRNSVKVRNAIVTSFSDTKKHCKKNKASSYNALDMGCMPVSGGMYMNMGCDESGLGYGYMFTDDACTTPSGQSPFLMFPGKCDLAGQAESRAESRRLQSYGSCASSSECDSGSEFCAVECFQGNCDSEENVCQPCVECEQDDDVVGSGTCSDLCGDLAGGDDDDFDGDDDVLPWEDMKYTWVTCDNYKK